LGPVHFQQQTKRKDSNNMITLECNYSKKIGLPQYSSHQFSITLRTEVADVNQVQPESARLYKLLQEGVDTSIKEVGFLPGSNANGSNVQHGGNGSNGGNGNDQPQGENGAWNCSAKQRDLIQKIVTEHNLEKAKIEALAQDRFGKGVKALNKLEASGLIEELLEQTGQNKGRGRFSSRFQRAGGR
jgi:hypothetical protein